MALFICHSTWFHCFSFYQNVKDRVRYAQCVLFNVLCLMCYVFQTNLNVIFYIGNAEKLHLLSEILQFNCTYD